MFEILETDIDRVGKQRGDGAFVSSNRPHNSPERELLRTSAHPKLKRRLESNNSGVAGYEAVAAWLNCVWPEVVPSKDSSEELRGMAGVVLWLRTVEHSNGDRRSRPAEVSTASPHASRGAPRTPVETQVQRGGKVGEEAPRKGETRERRLKTAGDRAAEPPTEETEGVSSLEENELGRDGEVRRGEDWEDSPPRPSRMLANVLGDESTIGANVRLWLERTSTISAESVWIGKSYLKL